MNTTIKSTYQHANQLYESLLPVMKKHPLITSLVLTGIHNPSIT